MRDVTPEEHYSESERLLASADRDVSENFATQTGEHKADVLAAAQTHALLALAGQNFRTYFGQQCDPLFGLEEVSGHAF